MKNNRVNEIKKKLVLNSCSEDFLFHIENNIAISENVFRPGSKKFFSIFNEARFYYNEGLYELFGQDYEYIVEHEVGKFALYEGKFVPLDFPLLFEAEYKGKKVDLNEPKGSSGDAHVYVNSGKKDKDGKIKVKKVSFGSSMPSAMGDSPAHKKRRKSFGDRHNCSDKKDKTAAGYWSCRATKFFGRDIAGWW